MPRPSEYNEPASQICAALPVSTIQKLDEAAEKAGCSRTKYLFLLIENDSGNLAAAIEVITKPLREEIERLKAQGSQSAASNQPAEPTSEQAMLQACQQNIELVRQYAYGKLDALTDLLDRYEGQFDRVTFKRFIDKLAEAQRRVEPEGLPI